MEFGIGKCAILDMKSSKKYMTDGMELQNHDIERSEKMKPTNTRGSWGMTPQTSGNERQDPKRISQEN